MQHRSIDRGVSRAPRARTHPPRPWPAALAAAALSLSGTGTAHADVPPFGVAGDSACTWGCDEVCNPCVDDVIASFHALFDGLADPGGFPNLPIAAQDDAGGVQPELTNACIGSNHIQGVGRLPVRGEPVFVFSRNTDLPEKPGIFAAVVGQVQSDGGRLLAVPGGDAAANRVVSYATTLGAGNHTGGLQTIGSYVVAGTGCWASGTCAGAPGRIEFFDFSIPDHPVLAGGFTPPAYAAGGDPGKVGVTRVRLPNGARRYLLTIHGTEWYLSDSESLATSTWRRVGTIDPARVIDPGGMGGSAWPPNPQNVNLLSECGSDQLYMVLTDDEGGTDQAWLYQIAPGPTSDRPRVIKRGHLSSPDKDCSACDPFCDDDAGPTFDASGNVYITPDHELVLYGTGKSECDGNGCVGAASGELRVIEYFNTRNVCDDAYLTSTGERPFASCPDADADCDGLTGAEEDDLGTSVDAADTDGDGLTDYEEVVIVDTDPLRADTDDDGLTDHEELLAGLDPIAPDTDGDGLVDGLEVALGTSPYDPDSDHDGAGDGQEVSWGRNPMLNEPAVLAPILALLFVDDDDDDDGDGVPDGSDACPFDPDNDEDRDGVCGDVDACYLDNAYGDRDADGICTPGFTVGAPTAGRLLRVSVANAAPGASVTLYASPRTGAGPCLPTQPDTCLELLNPITLAFGTADARGAWSTTIPVPRRVQPGYIISFQAVWSQGPRAESSDVATRVVR